MILCMISYIKNYDIAYDIIKSSDIIKYKNTYHQNKKLWYHKTMISYMIFPYYIWYHVWYHISKTMILHMISYIYDGIFRISCANDIIPKTMILHMISYFVLWYHVWYFKNNSKKPFLRYFHGWYHICLWYQKLMILSMISRMIRPSNISNLVYHSHMISWI